MTKEDVLALLEKSDAPVSGEQMCRALGMTRAGVWKAIEALRADGFDIEAAPRRGYRLCAKPLQKQALERLLDGVFARSPLPVSIKTRIGYTRPDEFDRLLDVFARYPIHELIIHPRTRVEFYKGTPHREAFAKAHAALDRPLCYNGDLFCEEDCRELMRQFPNTRALMLGRGLIANPALAQSLGGGEALCKASLRAFHDRLLEAYQAKYPAHVTLGRMREIAKHFVCCFDAPEKPRKAIRKTTRIEAYLDAIDRLFAEHELNETPRFIAE